MAEVTHTIDGHVATVVLSNEAKYNAMSFSMWTGLADALDAFRADENVRVVVLRGAGQKAFVSGADITEFETNRSSEEGVAAYDAAVERAQTALSQFPRPVIAAISGICYGGGMGMALACDLRYASPTSKFRMPAARLGLGYALKGMKRMVDVLGVANASELFITAKVVDSNEASRIGLINSVQDDVFAYVAQVAQDIASNAPMTIATAKLAINAILSGDASGKAAVDERVKACFASSDYAEGRKAFAEKRTPNFTGR